MTLAGVAHPGHIALVETAMTVLREGRGPIKSAETDAEKRRQIVRQIEKYLAEDGGRPIVFHPCSASRSYPEVKGITVGAKSPYNLWRMEDAWLGR
jgi:hypothetical protein